MKTNFTADDVQAHADKLTGPHVQILGLALDRDASYETMAAGLGVNVGTVKSRLHRARATLSKLLAAEKESTDA